MTAATPDEVRPDPALVSAELARRAQGGDRDALSELLRRHAPSIYKLCHHVAGPSEGRDVAQQALEKIVVRIHQFDPSRGTFKNWSLTVARNTCRDRLRRRGLERTTFHSDGEGKTQRASSRKPTPERVALARIEAADLAEALETLPEGMRSAIVLFHVHGESYNDIAETLAVPKGTVMTWLHRGRKRLRDALESR